MGLFCFFSAGTDDSSSSLHFRRFFDLQNQVSLDRIKLEKIGDYEKRIEVLTKTLAIWCMPSFFLFSSGPELTASCFSDEDLCKFSEQRRDMEKLSQEWKKADLLKESAQAEVEKLRATVEYVLLLSSWRHAVLIFLFRFPVRKTSSFIGFGSWFRILQLPLYPSLLSRKMGSKT